MIETAWFHTAWLTKSLEAAGITAAAAGLLLVFVSVLLYILYRLGIQWRRYQAGADPRRWTYLFGPTLEADRPASPSMPLLGSHRGFGKRAAPPENSEAAFEAAIGAGIDCIETDVIMTADGVPIIRHGPTAALAGRPDLKLEKLTLAEMRDLDFSSYLTDASLNHSIIKPSNIAWTGFLTLEEFLEKYSRRVMINLELKRWDIVDWRFERKVAAILKPYMNAGARIFCSSFNPFSLLRMRHYLPDICLGMLWRDDLNWFARNRSLMFFTRPDFIHPHEKRLDPELMDYAREKKYRVHTWVVNDAARFHELTGMGAGMIITDHVREALAWAGRPPMEAPAPDAGVLPRAM